MKESEAPPFALAEIPTVLGDWHAIEGSEDTLEPEIAKIAGAKDHLIRTYEDDKSGQRASVMVLYGLAYIVWAHSPDVCYPATGFRTLLPSQDQDLEIPVPEKSTTARFRLQHFVKSKAGQTDYRQVYYSFQNAGRWGVDMGRNWKSFRYHPGMFRVQVQCQGFEPRQDRREFCEGAYRANCPGNRTTFGSWWLNGASHTERAT